MKVILKKIFNKTFILSKLFLIILRGIHITGIFFVVGD
jgi:hypothetical protein